MNSGLRRTKIVATLGPATDDPAVLAEMVRAGVDVVRLNFSHGAVADHARRVELVREAQAELLMKGSLHTDELMAAVVSREGGLRTNRRISHVFVMDVPTYHKVLFVTDGAINITPTLEDKAEICQNAIDLIMALGLKKPKVAILAAVEQFGEV